MTKKQYSAALDLSGPEASLAVLDSDGRCVFSEQQPMKGRLSATLALFVSSNLERRDIHLAEITDWTVGSGPGSFTGMRIAAALVGGWCFGRATARTRCVPSAFAAVCGAFGNAKAGESAEVWYDGRNHELLVFDLRRSPLGWAPEGEGRVLTADEARRAGAVHSVKRICPIWDVEAVRSLSGMERIATAEHMNCAYLAAAPEALYPFDGELMKLYYIRPAVFTKPVES